MNEKKMAETVALLKDGQRVEIDGLIFSAKRVPSEFHTNPCHVCNVDCLCRGDVAEVCFELDFMSKSRWYLNLISI